MIDYDAELRAHNERLRAAAGVAPGDHVLDIGCGTGQSTRDAARAATAGRALGVDVSAPMLEQARRLTIAEQLHNVTYEHGDAQVHPFAPGHHDLAISRFGTMFFSDPVAAFSNIARALRVGGRLVLLVWQSRESNEWARAIGTALNRPAQPMAPVMKADAFSLGDRTATARLLESAGFDGVRFSDVREPVFYGPTSLPPWTSCSASPAKRWRACLPPTPPERGSDCATRSTNTEPPTTASCSTRAPG